MKPLLVRALDDETFTVRMGGAAFSLLSLGIRSLEGDAERSFPAAKEIDLTRAGTSSLHLDPEHRNTTYYRALARLGEGRDGEAGVKFDAAKKIYVKRAATSPDHAPTQLALGKF